MHTDYNAPDQQHITWTDDCRTGYVHETDIFLDSDGVPIDNCHSIDLETRESLRAYAMRE